MRVLKIADGVLVFLTLLAGIASIYAGDIYLIVIWNILAIFLGVRLWLGRKEKIDKLMLETGCIMGYKLGYADAAEYIIGKQKGGWFDNKDVKKNMKQHIQDKLKQMEENTNVR